MAVCLSRFRKTQSTHMAMCHCHAQLKPCFHYLNTCAIMGTEVINSLLENDLKLYQFNHDLRTLRNRTSWSSGFHSYFVFKRSGVQISARRPAILAVSCGFFSVPPGKFRYSTELGHDRFLPNPFQFIIHLSPLHSTLCSLS
jgi:hypothetical protein